MMVEEMNFVQQRMKYWLYQAIPISQSHHCPYHNLAALVIAGSFGICWDDVFEKERGNFSSFHIFCFLFRFQVITDLQTVSIRKNS